MARLLVPTPQKLCIGLSVPLSFPADSVIVY